MGGVLYNMIIENIQHECLSYTTNKTGTWQMLILKVNINKIRHIINIKIEQEYKTKYSCLITPTYTKLTWMFIYKDKLK